MTAAGSERLAPGDLPLGRRDRLVAWLATGPLGRIVAFLWDLGAAWVRWARRRRAPERTR